MAKQIIEKDGIVQEAQMGGMFNVMLEDETVAIATLSGKIRKFRIRILPGDKVKMEFSPHDLTRGRITYRYRPERSNQETQLEADKETKDES